MKSEGREVCRLARGTLYAENDRAYFLKLADQRVEISKSAVAMAVHGGDAAGVADCKTLADTSKSAVFAPVINPSAVSNQVTAPVNLHVIQLPAPGGLGGGQPHPGDCRDAAHENLSHCRQWHGGRLACGWLHQEVDVLPFFPPKVRSISSTMIRGKNARRPIATITAPAPRRTGSERGWLAGLCRGRQGGHEKMPRR